MKGLTEEHKDLLRDMVGSEHWDAVMAICEIAVRNHERQVLNVDINKGARALVIEKARLDGAKSLVKALSSIREEFRKHEG